METLSYSVSQMLGDIAGMFGTLMGVDAINVIFWLEHMLLLPFKEKMGGADRSEWERWTY